MGSLGGIHGSLGGADGTLGPMGPGPQGSPILPPRILPPSCLSIPGPAGPGRPGRPGPEPLVRRLDICHRESERIFRENGYRGTERMDNAAGLDSRQYFCFLFSVFCRAESQVGLPRSLGPHGERYNYLWRLCLRIRMAGET